MARTHRHEPTRIAANLTPMIDVVFLLIVFFVLVSQIVDLENVKMDLPVPIDPASEMADDERRVVVNVEPTSGGRVAGYRLGARFFGADTAGLKELSTTLASLYQDMPDMRVNLRADRSTHYQWVQPALEAVARAARQAGRDIVPGVNLVVVREDP